MTKSKVVAVFGANGMLGRYVKAVLRGKHYIRSHTRRGLDVAGASTADIEKIVDTSEVVVNCAGLIKQRGEISLVEMIQVNSVFPHLLADVCEKKGIPMIHITTDCVFNGRGGNYTETSAHTALDPYGRTKSLGEPINACGIRTSIIGEKPGDPNSLLEWAKSQKGKKIFGFLNHWWNGVTCLQLAKIIDQIIDEELYWKGTYHIFSPKEKSKYSLLHIINDVYDLGMEIEGKRTDSCNRILSSNRDKIFSIPTLQEQIQEQKEFVVR